MTDNTTPEICANCAFVLGLKSHAEGSTEPRLYCEMWHEMMCSYGKCDEFKARGGRE